MTMVQVSVQFHVSQGRKAVEPGIGHGFHGLRKAITLNAGDELVTLAMDFDGPGLAGNDSYVTLWLAGSHFQLARPIRQTQQIGARSDSCDEVFAGLRGV